MKVIITGGTGLIGRNLAARLTQAGHTVILLTRHPDRATLRPNPAMTLQKWDGKTAQGWGHLVEDAHAIVNLAGESLAAGLWTEERKKRILSSRIDAGKAVIQAVEAATKKPEVIIQSSAVGYYGPCGDEVLTEDSPPGTDFLSRVCQEWEASTAPAKTLGVRWVVIRTGVVLDRHEGALPRLVLPFKFMAGGPIGSGRQWLPWIHLQDTVAGIHFLIENPGSQGVYNLTAPTPQTNAQFAQSIGRVLHRPAWLPAPAFALRLALGEMSTVVLDGQRAIPARLQAEGFQYQYPEPEGAIRAALNSP